MSHSSQHLSFLLRFSIYSLSFSIYFVFALIMLPLYFLIKMKSSPVLYLKISTLLTISSYSVNPFEYYQLCRIELLISFPPLNLYKTYFCTPTKKLWKIFYILLFISFYIPYISNCNWIFYFSFFSSTVLPHYSLITPWNGLEGLYQSRLRLSFLN